jgi:hypothetical protein
MDNEYILFQFLFVTLIFLKKEEIQRKCVNKQASS